jgi:cell wall-associated NlpC family hydrolase
MNESELRATVIAEAMSWQGTPHHNGACLKGTGVDCGQFPIAVFEKCGLIPHIETGRYSPQFHLHKDEEWYLKICRQYGRELIKGSIPKPADFVLYKIGRIFSHGAIVVEWPLIIHSYVGIGVTLDHGDRGWMAKLKNGNDRPIKFFSAW